jgi:uncharacterized protein YjdB
VTWLRVAVLAALTGGCGKLPTGEGGAAFLEVTPPSTLTVAVGKTLQFRAQALNKVGDPLPDVLVHWRTADSAITIGETSGLVTGVSVGTGRVQAFIGKDQLVSDFVSVTVTAPASP